MPQQRLSLPSNYLPYEVLSRFFHNLILNDRKGPYLPDFDRKFANKLIDGLNTLNKFFKYGGTKYIYKKYKETMVKYKHVIIFQHCSIPDLIIGGTELKNDFAKRHRFVNCTRFQFWQSSPYCASLDLLNKIDKTIPSWIPIFGTDLATLVKFFLSKIKFYKKKPITIKKKTNF